MSKLGVCDCPEAEPDKTRRIQGSKLSRLEVLDGKIGLFVCRESNPMLYI